MLITRIRRLIKHRWQDEQALQATVPPELLRELSQTVQASERLHTGEIRVHIETSLPLSYLWRSDSMQKIVRDRAVTLFGKLRVWDTEDNNGVLIYLLLPERAIEVVADRGINARVPAKAWADLVTQMAGDFRSGRFDVGLRSALQQISALLCQHYPSVAGQHNPNELPDDVTLD